MHPADPCAVERVRIAAEEGFRGLKFHPYYQDFDLDDPAMDPLYGAMEEHRMICVSHTGFDHAFPFVRRADPGPHPARGWRSFRGCPSWRRISGPGRTGSSSRGFCRGPACGWTSPTPCSSFLPEEARRLMLSFPADRLLFGSDSPWAGQQESLALVRALGLDPSRERALLAGKRAGAFLLVISRSPAYTLTYIFWRRTNALNEKGKCCQRDLLGRDS